MLLSTEGKTGGAEMEDFYLFQVLKMSLAAAPTVDFAAHIGNVLDFAVDIGRESEPPSYTVESGPPPTLRISLR